MAYFYPGTLALRRQVNSWIDIQPPDNLILFTQERSCLGIDEKWLLAATPHPVQSNLYILLGAWLIRTSAGRGIGSSDWRSFLYSMSRQLLRVRWDDFADVVIGTEHAGQAWIQWNESSGSYIYWPSSERSSRFYLEPILPLVEVLRWRHSLRKAGYFNQIAAKQLEAAGVRDSIEEAFRFVHRQQHALARIEQRIEELELLVLQLTNYN